MNVSEDQEEYYKEEAEDLYQNAPCGYISILPDRTISKINNILLNWLGYSREELVLKKKFTDLVTIGGKIYFETHHDPLQRMQGFVSELSYDLVRKDGSTIPCLLNSVLKKDGHGNILLARTTVFDITERKKYEKELLRSKKEADRAAKAKSQLLSVMSHEIRTPMNAIIGMSHLLLGDNPKPEQIENLQILKTSAENLLQLLNSILDYSKMDAGKMALDETDFSLSELLAGIVNTLKVKSEENGVELKLEVDHAIPPVLRSDQVKISQVLTNLIGNAIKFTREGSVKVSAKLIKSEGDKVEIHFSVKDTGVGIPQHKWGSIFNEFEQASADVSREFGGTGLGLSISKKLLTLFGSSIQLQSEVGKGSEFSFTLTLQVSDKVLVRDSWGSKEIKSAGLRGIKLLLVEDNTVNVLVITKFLQNWQITYEVARDGNEAFELIQQHDYDLILMDLQMPVMNGYETTLKVRELKDTKYQKLPIIAMTASAIIGSNHKIFRVGMNDFVSKPFDPKDLYHKLLKYGKSNINLENYLEKNSAIPDNASVSLIDFEKFEILAEGDLTFLAQLTEETITSFETYRIEFKNAILKRNIESYNNSVHKIKLVVDILNIKQLENTLDVGHSLLTRQESDVLVMFLNELDTILLRIVNELENQLFKIQDGQRENN